jgi:hypothetical protein
MSGDPSAPLVRRATSADRPALATFIAEAYGARAVFKDERRWLWQFVRNPAARSRDGDVPVWIALDGGAVVGQIAVQEATLRVEGISVPAGWIVDVMVLPSHRGAGLGHRIHDALAGDIPLLVTLTMAPATRRISERAGCITLGPVHQYSRWARLDADTVGRYVSTRTVGHRWVGAVAALGCRRLRLHRAFASAVNLLLRLRRSTPPPSCEISEVDRFGDDVDRLWERTRGDWPVIFERTTSFLNWRFADCPDLAYRLFVARRGAHALGYVVLRRTEPVELSQGIIVDLYASRRDSNVLDDLVRHSLAFFGNDVAGIECATSVPEIARVLRRHGFFRTRTHHPTVVSRDPELRARLERLRDHWFFSKADHDWDQIHVASSFATTPRSTPSLRTSASSTGRPAEPARTDRGAEQAARSS